MSAHFFADAAQVTLSGLATGALYAVLLLGVVLVFQVSKNINFAYGQTGMVGAFLAFELYSGAGLPVWLAVLLGIAAAALLAALTDRLIIRNIPPREGFDLVVTLGELLLLTALSQMVFGTRSQDFLKLLTGTAIVRAGVYINGNDIACILLGMLVTAGGHLVLTRTSLGTSLRASAASPPIAQSAGINVLGLRTGVWAASGLLVAVGAMLFAARLSLNAFYMTPIMINVFVAGMIGGLDRYWPPMLAAFGIAVCQSWAIYLFGEPGGTPALFLLVIAILSLVPKRLLEERYEARA